MTDFDLDELRSELDGFAKPDKRDQPSAREQRIIAGFEEIERFVQEHGRLPEHGEGRDIFERLYAVRLDRIRQSAECRELLKDRDPQGLLPVDTDGAAAEAGELSDEELLAALGGEASPENDVTRLVHVRTPQEIKAAEEVAQRNPCEDFDVFRTVFETVQRELEAGILETVKYKTNAEISKGDLFILDGQKVLVAAMGAPFVSDYGRPDRRLRVIYDNGTESDLLLRSLQRALYKDKASRRIVERVDESDAMPLFSDQLDEDGDVPTGRIYVLRSLSDHPFIAKHRNTIHKIGVTGGDVKSRIANARKDPTYLLADVETVATYHLANVNRRALEKLLHRFFADARLDLELKDRFGESVEPREWFLVPLPAIAEAIERIKDGTIGRYRYDPRTANLSAG